VRKENEVKTGWKLVARLGMSGPGYPHLLVDRHGWCLRLGPNPKADDKYYSRLLFLLEGLIEQALRRDVLAMPAAAMSGELRAILKESLRSAIELGTRLENIVQETPIRLPGASARPDLKLGGTLCPQDVPSPFQANVGA
jgi:hypothetical protein